MCGVEWLAAFTDFGKQLPGWPGLNDQNAQPGVVEHKVQQAAAESALWPGHLFISHHFVSIKSSF